MRLGPPWLLGPVGSEFLGSMTVLWKSRRFTRGSQVDVFFANPHLIQLFPQFLLIPGTPRDPRRTNSKQLGLPVGHSKQSSGLCVPSWLLHLPDPLKIRWDEGIYNGEDLNHVNDPIFKTHLKLNVKFNGEDHRQPTWGFEHWKEMIHRRFSIVIKTGEFYWTFCCLGNGRKMFSQSMLWAIAWKDYSRIARVNQMEFSHSRTPEKKKSLGTNLRTRLFKTAVLQSISTGWYTAGASHVGASTEPTCPQDRLGNSLPQSSAKNLRIGGRIGGSLWKLLPQSLGFSFDHDQFWINGAVRKITRESWLLLHHAPHWCCCWNIFVFGISYINADGWIMLNPYCAGTNPKPLLSMTELIKSLSLILKSKICRACFIANLLVTSPSVVLEWPSSCHNSPTTKRAVGFCTQVAPSVFSLSVHLVFVGKVWKICGKLGKSNKPWRSMRISSQWPITL